MSIDNAAQQENHPAAIDARDDVKRLIDGVIGQIAASERRTGETLRQMRERIDALSQGGRETRTALPQEYQAGFERIEDGMTLLASRITESCAALKQAAHAGQALQQAPGVPRVGPTLAGSLFAEETAAAATGSADDAGTDREVYIPFPTAPAEHGGATAPALAGSPDAAQPQPLASSSRGLLRPRTHNYMPNVDPFDVIETVPGPGDEAAWSSDDAEALSVAYGAEPIMPVASAVTATMPVASAAPDTTGTDRFNAVLLAATDRSWLDDRLGEIAARVERSLAASRADASIATVENRLTAFEQTFNAALATLATRNDVAQIARIEDDVRTLRADFEAAHANLTRVAEIERQIGEIARQTSQESLAALAVRPAAAEAAPRNHIELHALAIAAAEATASRIYNAPGRIDDVHALLAQFIDERRMIEEQTASTLDTLQQAMLRILDRVEAIEADPATAALAQPHMAPQPFGPEHYGYHEPEASRPAPETALDVFAATNAAAHDGYATYHAPATAAPTPATINPAVPAPAAAEAPAAPAPVQPQVQAQAPTQAPAAPVDAPMPAGDYIAQQRAKMQASVQRAAAAQREKNRTAQQDGDKEAPARPSKAPTPAANGRRLMVSSLALAVVAGGAGALTLLATSGQKAGSAAVATLADTTKASQASLAGTNAAETVAAASVATDTAAGSLSDADAAAFTTPTTVNGILLQTGGAQATQTASAAAAPQEPAAVVQKAAVRPGEAVTENGTPSLVSPDGRTALDLPPATVGPMSLRLAAAQGDMSAEFEVASRLAEGKGTEQNIKEAVRWYTRSASQGFAQAQYRLGTFYERGLGVKADLARARSWYQRAAEQGNVKAMHNLAVLSAGRTAQAPDYATAARWFTQAAAHGLPDSQFNLAVLSESGLGIARDMVQAAMWYELAARSGDKEAVKRRDQLRAKMDPADVAAVDHLVSTWQPSVPDKLANDPRAAGEAWKTRQASGTQAN